MRAGQGFAFSWLAFALAAGGICLPTATGEALAQAQTTPAAEKAPLDTVTLSSGELLEGRIIAVTDQSIVMEHPLLGRLTIERANIKAFTSGTKVNVPPPPPSPPPQTPAEGQPATPARPAEAKAEPAQANPVKWLWRIEAGLSGSEGRTENFDGRFRIAAKRESADTRLSLDANYLVSSSNGDRTANRFDAGVLNDWLFPDSPWLAFAQGRVFVDEFASYDYRLTGAGGVGYDFVKNDDTTITGRVGAGASRSFGDPNNDSIVPEALLGLDITHKFSDTTKFTFKGEYYPSLKTFGDFRALLDGGIETKIDKARGLSLKFGARDDIERLDKNDANNDLLEVYAALVFEF